MYPFYTKNITLFYNGVILDSILSASYLLTYYKGGIDVYSSTDKQEKISHDINGHTVILIGLSYSYTLISSLLEKVNYLVIIGNDNYKNIFQDFIGKKLFYLYEEETSCLEVVKKYFPSVSCENDD